MKKILPALVFVVAAFAAFPARAQFTAGNIVVLQVGNGIGPLSNNATPVFLREYSTVTAGQTMPVHSVTMPTRGAARLIIEGTTVSEGQIMLSADSLKLTIAGYDTGAVVTTWPPSIQSASVINRVIDTISYLGLPGRAVTTNYYFGGANIYGAVKV